MMSVFHNCPETAQANKFAAKGVRATKSATAAAFAGWATGAGNVAFSIARRLGSAALLTLVLGWAFFAVATPAHAAGRDSGTAGSVTGVLTNGTTSQPIAGQQVTLQLNVSSSIKNLATTTTAANGAFTFPNVDATPASLDGAWAVFTSYQGGMYASQAVTVTAGKSVDASFMAYNATQDSANLRISSATILVRSVDALHGLVTVAEIQTVTNTGKTAFVGAPPDGNSATMPPLLRFYVPNNAINLSTGAGFDGTQIFQVGTGFAASATVPPGTSEFAFAFQMPYTGATLDIPFKAEYPTDQVDALIPPSMLARDNTGLTAQGVVTSFGAQYQVYTATNLKHDAQVTLSLYELTKAGQSSDLNFTGLIWFGAILALLLAALAGWYLWRGALVPAPAAEAALAIGDFEAQHKATLQQALDLERRHARGVISDAEFKRQNATLRQRLRAQLSASAPTMPASAPRPTTEGTPASADGASAESASAEATSETASQGKGGAR